MQEAQLLPASAAPGAGMHKKEAAASMGAKFPVARGRRGMEKREITVFCSHAVRGLQHHRRGGPCTFRHRSCTVIIALQAKSKSRDPAPLLTAQSLLDTAMPRASGKATW